MNQPPSNATQIPLTGNAILAAADLFSRELEKVTSEKKALEERIFWAEEKEASFNRLVTERNKAYADERKAREENTTLKAELEAAKREADYLRTILSAVQIEVVQ